MFVATTLADCTPSPERCANPAGRSAANEPDGVDCHRSCARTRATRQRVPLPLLTAGSQAQASFSFVVAILGFPSQEVPRIILPAGNPFPCGARVFYRSGKVLSR